MAVASRSWNSFQAPFWPTTATLTNTIVAGNQGDGSFPGHDRNCQTNGASRILDGGGNLTTPGSLGCPATLLAGDPKLLPLAPSGGPTQTMALGDDSAAIDTAVDALCPTTDQRGVARPQGEHCDIGAYERTP